jgi:hypothetical protein
LPRASGHVMGHLSCGAGHILKVARRAAAWAHRGKVSAPIVREPPTRGMGGKAAACGPYAGLQFWHTLSAASAKDFPSSQGLHRRSGTHSHGRQTAGAALFALENVCNRPEVEVGAVLSPWPAGQLLCREHSSTSCASEKVPGGHGTHTSRSSLKVPGWQLRTRRQRPTSVEFSSRTKFTPSQAATAGAQPAQGAVSRRCGCGSGSGKALVYACKGTHTR